MDSEHQQRREEAAKAQRVVIKIGTRVLVRRDGRPNRARMAAIAHEAAELRRAGREVVIVSSGAVGAGLESLKLKRRPTKLEDLQMVAAVGQSRLMAQYAELFKAERCVIGQVLLTHDDMKHRQRHLNARNTMLNLLKHGVIPIVNENDTVSTDEIKVGDNDVLAALVSILIDADLLALLTSADGLRAPDGPNRTKRVPYVATLTPEIRALASGKGDPLSTGGMASKLDAANMLCRTGALSLILDGRRPEMIGRAVAGEDVGTLMGQPAEARLRLTTKRKIWIAFFNRPQGSLKLDAGARAAVRDNGKSLLPSGIKKVDGDFTAGSVLQLKDHRGRVFAQGICAYASTELARIKGRQSAEVAGLLGRSDAPVVVHRDDLVLL